MLAISAAVFCCFMFTIGQSDENFEMLKSEQAIQRGIENTTAGREGRLFYQKDINTVISQAPNNTAALTFLPLYTLLFGLNG